jgi:large subunit ribosomal protein L5
MSRLRKRYLQDVRPALQEKFSYKNSMLIPSLKKIVVSMGVAEAAKDKNALEDHFKELAVITGQLPKRCKSRQAISNFKLRQDQVIGLMVTLRGKRMYDFADRFFNIVSPRIRDFRGFKRKGDGRGSYSLGIDDQQIFPEVNLDNVKRQQGMNVTFVTDARTDPECIELLQQLGCPFKAQA